MPPVQPVPPAQPLPPHPLPPQPLPVQPLIVPPPLTRARYAVRCSVVAALAYIAAQHIGLPHSVWAPISALVVSQENVRATLSSMVWRVVGTVLGVVVALLVHWLGTWADIPLVVQIAGAVGICGVFSAFYPTIRVSLWTCPLVLVGTGPAPVGDTPNAMEINALLRGVEVVLGVLVGGLCHLAEDRLFNRLFRRYIQPA